MAYFSVSYQLNNAKKYEPLWKEMEDLGAHKAMKDYYLLDVNLDTAAELRDHLSNFVDNDDFIFVALLSSKPAAKRCYQGTAAWINARFP